MAEDLESYRYDKMVEAALRGVVKSALEEVIEKGLFDDHHFYITFRTDHAGVEIPDYLRERYPGEMTIVLQHQFYDLEVNDKRFTVMLKFNNVPERLQIPLTAITIFTDPSVNFALQFQPLSEEDEDIDYGDDELDVDDGDEGSTGEVISLDQFRQDNQDSKKSKKKKMPKKGDNDEDDEKEDKKKSSKKTSKKSSDKKPSAKKPAKKTSKKKKDDDKGKDKE